MVFSGHVDSWDVGTGAVDDGGGLAAARDAILAIAELARIDPNFRPKRTLRGIFFADEEQGYNGAKQYFSDHWNRTEEKFFFVSESDNGAFKPLNYNSVLSFSGNRQHKRFFLKMLRLINDAGIPLSLRDGGPGAQGDVKFFAEQGVPSTHYVSDRGENLGLAKNTERQKDIKLVEQRDPTPFQAQTTTSNSITLRLTTSLFLKKAIWRLWPQSGQY